jgi:hypothetical protein
MATQHQLIKQTACRDGRVCRFRSFRRSVKRFSHRPKPKCRLTSHEQSGSTLDCQATPCHEHFLWNFGCPIWGWRVCLCESSGRAGVWPGFRGRRFSKGVTWKQATRCFHFAWCGCTALRYRHFAVLAHDLDFKRTPAPRQSPIGAGRGVPTLNAETPKRISCLRVRFVVHCG